MARRASRTAATPCWIGAGSGPIDRLLDLNGYIGPAPVSLQAYTDIVSHQNQTREPVPPESLQ